MRPTILCLSLIVISLMLTAEPRAQTSPRLFSEVHVMRSLRQIHAAQATYQATTGNGNFGSLQSLLQSGLIDDALASGYKYGYLYVVTTVAVVPGQSPAAFTLTATPRTYRKTGIRSFFIDASGDMRGADKNGSPADPGDPIIDDCTNGGIFYNERCTIGDLRVLHSVQMTYAATIGNGNFATFPELRKAGLIRADLSDYHSRGYLYQVLFIDQVPGQNPSSFKIWASPEVYGVTGRRSFYIDQTGVLRGADRNGGQADHTDPPINE